ncbi:hypothetical protein CISG_08354 [Coccidioides immitis RMSCC 3703]|uniref:Uncharacterized protein n=1 Tax=Coccidioides immitis RMSCC 3703 TaxID=454286 RepID=A0A0J8R900_COCIT|nr:hypothetical protein CISG_08354 [Coccidioides immitis RMSCC 3703]
MPQPFPPHRRIFMIDARLASSRRRQATPHAPALNNPGRKHVRMEIERGSLEIHSSDCISIEMQASKCSIYGISYLCSGNAHIDDGHSAELRLDPADDSGRSLFCARSYRYSFGVENIEQADRAQTQLF